MKRAARVLLRLALAGIALVVIALVTGILLVRTDWFRSRVRDRIVSVTEQATGGRVEIGSFTYDWHNLTADVAPFVLHGTEPAGDPPLFRADRIRIGLKIISALEKKVDLSSLDIDHPRVHIVVAPDGRTNFPTPKIRPYPDKSFIEDLLSLRIRDLTLRDGFAEINSRRIPLDVRATHFSARFGYQASGPRYLGEVASRTLSFDSGPLHAANFQLETAIAIENTRLRFDRTRLRMHQSSIDLAGLIENFGAPSGRFDVKAELFPADIARSMKLPVENRGVVGFAGTAAFTAQDGFHYSLDGKLTGRGLGFSNRYVNIGGIWFASGFRLTPDLIALRGISAKALDGDFHGGAEIRDRKKLTLDGAVAGFSLAELARMQGRQSGQLSGTVSGPVHAESILTATGLRQSSVEAKVEIAPGAQGTPVRASIDMRYEQAGDRLALSNSTLDLGGSHAELSGTLGRDLAVRATSRNLNDVFAAFPLLGLSPPRSVPIALKGGSASFDGHMVGPLANPHFSGRAAASRFVFENRAVDHAAATIDLTPSGITAHSLEVDQKGLHLEGSGSLALRNWRYWEDSSAAAKLTLRGADLQTVLHELAPDSGLNRALASAHATVSGIIDFSGTLKVPHATAHLQASNVAVYDEKADRLQADLTISGKTMAIDNARVVAGSSEITGKGVYTRAGEDWTNGQLRFSLSTHNFSLAQSATLRKLRAGLGGQATAQAEGAGQIVKGDFRLDSLASHATIANVTLDNRPYGNVQVNANASNSLLKLEADANVRGTPLHGSGEWKLTGDYPGQGAIVIPRMTVSAMHQLIPNTSRPDLPFVGYVEGRVDITGPLKKTDQLKAAVRIATVQINPGPDARLRAGAQQRDLVLRNSRPVLLEATTKTVDIRSAVFTGPDTTLEAQGHISLDSKNPWDLRLNGSINLAILQLFNPDLLASGNATVNTTVRGAFSEPEIGGRLQLNNASLYIADVPNGLDQANGVIFFDRNRATVSRLSAVSGGGRVSFDPGSFVGFRGPTLLYRIQGSADHVRYRSPEGVSVTVNAALSLLGTSDNSILSGTVTVTRAAFNPKTDVGSLLATTAKPVSAPAAPNVYLRGIQFDIRVEGAQSLEIQTSLTRNIEAEANLRVRGTPERPVVLGSISVNEGEIEFFGNRYTINRGDVNFYNSAKIEPIIDMDLETSVRGVNVDITFSGPLNKLNFSYRSDPPLQTNDIIALLAVGRAPSSTGALASSQTVGGTNYLSTGSNALLSQAISAPAAGRLQRFFGVSHFKIDPQLTDLTSVPQARVTLEQQVSKDVTLTYITNLTRTQEQILRVEWDLNRQWSVIALRDENGAFGIDFQYRKRFK